MNTNPETVTQNRILEIGYEQFALPSNMSDADMIKLLQLMPIFTAARKVSTSEYIPDKESMYGGCVTVFQGSRLKVEIHIANGAILENSKYEELRALGQAEYDAAHPKPAVIVATGTASTVTDGGAT